MPDKAMTLPELIAELESRARIESGRSRVAMERAARVLRAVQATSDESRHDERYGIGHADLDAAITRAMGEINAG